MTRGLSGEGDKALDFIAKNEIPSTREYQSVSGE